MVNPKLRFKRPDGTAYPDWEEKRLGECFSERVERSKGNEELLSVSINNGVTRQSEGAKRDASSEDKKNYKVVHVGDIAYNTMRMWQGAEGRSPYDGIVSPAYTIVVPVQGVADSCFFEQFFKNGRMIKMFERHSQGLTSDTWNLKFDAFSKIKVKVPSIEEQGRVVEGLASVDEKIEAQEQHVTVLETQKKELLRQVFAREIRFKDENGQDYPQWEEHPLSDYLSFQNGVNADREAYGKGVKLISVRDILSGRPILYDMISGAVQIDDATLSRYSVAYGDVLFQRSSENYEDAGTANVYLDDKIATFSGFVIRGKKIAEYNPVFMYCALNDACVRKQITRKAQGAQHVNVGQDTLASVIISVPSLPEQQRISDFFTALDAQIENERALLEDWRQLKKGLLQQMFI